MMMSQSDIETKDKSLNRSFIGLMIGQCISYIGDSFTGIALMWFIVQTGSAMQMGINMALAFIPNLILAPFMGSIVDRISRKKLLWVSDLLRFLLDIVLIIAISYGWFSIYIIYIYTVLKAIVRLAYIPAQQSVIQQLTVSKQRVKANALQDLSARTAMVAGPILAGLAVKFMTMSWVVCIDAVTFLISASIIYFITVDESHLKKARSSSSYWQQMREGFAYVGIHRWIILLSFAFAFVNGGNALAMLTRPFLINDKLGLGADAFGFLTSLGSVGAMITAAILFKVKLKGHKLNYVIISILFWGAGIVLLSLANSFWLAAAFQLMAFSMGPLMGINSNTFYQDEIPSEFMGRVYAVRSFVSTLAMPVGYLFGNAVISRFGISGSFIVSGAVVLMGAVFAFSAKSFHGKLTRSLDTQASG